jgi:predicted secreted protein
MEVLGMGGKLLRNISQHTIHTNIIGDNPEKALYTGPVHLYGVYRDLMEEVRMMDTYALKQQQSLLKRLTNALLLALLVAAMSLAMTATPSYAIAYSPPSSWANTYGGTEDEDAFWVQQTSDRGFIVGGTTASFGVSGQDFWIVKLNSDGKIQWQRAYGGGGNDALFSGQQTSDGGYIAAGLTESFGAGMRDFWVLKLDDDGDIEWQNAYGGSNNDGPASAIQQTSDGGYITGGFTYSFGEGGDLLVLKLDALGNIEWQKNYGGTSVERRVQNIRQTSDSGFILTSTTTTTDVTPSSAWVLKLEDDGDIQWQKAYSDAEASIDVEDIQLTNDGGYIVLAERYVPLGPLGQDFWVLKLEDDGDIQWQKAYGGTGNDDAQPIRQTSDGGYIMGGSTQSFGVTGEDFWIVKLYSDGNIQWEKTYGGSRDDEAISLVQTSDGGYIAAGGTDSFGTEDKDFWVLRLNEDGDIGCCLTSDLITSSSATVTDTTVTPFNTTVTAADSEATMTQTTANVTDTSATLRKQCFSKVIIPGLLAQCLTAEIGLRVHDRLVIGLAAVALIFLIAAVARRRKDQKRKSP